MSETGKAILTKIEPLPEQSRSGFTAHVYTYTLEPPTTWKGIPYQAKKTQVIALDTVTVTVLRGETQLHAHGQRLQCRGRLGGSPIYPDEFLPAFCGYEETVLSRVQRLVGTVEVSDTAPATLTHYLSFASAALWPQLSIETRLIVAALVRQADVAVEAAKHEDTDEWGDDNEDGDEGDGTLLHELRGIRQLLEERL